MQCMPETSAALQLKSYERESQVAENEQVWTLFEGESSRVIGAKKIWKRRDPRPKTL